MLCFLYFGDVESKSDVDISSLCAALQAIWIGRDGATVGVSGIYLHQMRLCLSIHTGLAILVRSRLLVGSYTSALESAAWIVDSCVASYTKGPFRFRSTF